MRWKMKSIVKILSLIAILTIFVRFDLLSQKPDEELTKKEAIQRIAEFQNIVNDLQSKLNALDADIQKLQDDLNQTNKRLNDCLDNYLGLLGINPETNKPFTKEDMEKFKQKLGQIEGKIREMQRLSNDELADRRKEVEELENSLNQIRMIKLAILPEFYNKIISLASEIKGLYREKKIKTYTVGTWAENRDCLWNIAAKTEFFGDPFMWPKIWQANTNLIKNPDIIYPGQQLTIPPPGPKTPDEIKAERKYWRMKKAAVEREQNEGETKSTETKK
ncbi:LysM peptidoglycan-binding domain-containing protein [Bacteroidetes/Chlorobi group bacterium MS-B_bin-24]|nr:MAG: LysM peptidoglycan-binding domain-containing protein [Bacteroidetes/Chlorobi group bacterium MS-B_bin-24]